MCACNRLTVDYENCRLMTALEYTTMDTVPVNDGLTGNASSVTSSWSRSWFFSTLKQSGQSINQQFKNETKIMRRENIQDLVCKTWINKIKTKSTGYFSINSFTTKPIQWEVKFTCFNLQFKSGVKPAGSKKKLNYFTSTYTV